MSGIAGELETSRPPSVARRGARERGRTRASTRMRVQSLCRPRAQRPCYRARCSDSTVCRRAKVWRSEALAGRGMTWAWGKRSGSTSATPSQQAPWPKARPLLVRCCLSTWPQQDKSKIMTASMANGYPQTHTRTHAHTHHLSAHGISASRRGPPVICRPSSAACVCSCCKPVQGKCECKARQGKAERAFQRRQPSAFHVCPSHHQPPATATAAAATVSSSLPPAKHPKAPQSIPSRRCSISSTPSNPH